jgi:hypothetical protein
MGRSRALGIDPIVIANVPAAGAVFSGRRFKELCLHGVGEPRVSSGMTPRRATRSPTQRPKLDRRLRQFDEAGDTVMNGTVSE